MKLVKLVVAVALALTLFGQVWSQPVTAEIVDQQTQGTLIFMQPAVRGMLFIFLWDIHIRM